MWKVATKLAALWIIHGSGILFYRLIQSYHYSKPLGRQTLLGKVISSLFMNVLICMAVYHAIPITIFILLTPLEDHQFFDIDLNIFVFLSCVTIIASEIALLFVLTTKYLSIYHSTFVYALNEDKTIDLLKAMTYFLALSLTTIEYNYLTRLDNAVMYQVFLTEPKNNEANVEKVKILVFVLIFLISGFMQARLEFDEKKSIIFKCFQKQTSSQNIGQIVDDNGQNDYKPKVLNVALTAFSSIFLLATIQTVVGTGSIAANMVVVFSITYILLPLYRFSI